MPVLVRRDGGNVPMDLGISGLVFCMVLFRGVFHSAVGGAYDTLSSPVRV